MQLGLTVGCNFPAEASARVRGPAHLWLLAALGAGPRQMAEATDTAAAVALAADLTGANPVVPPAGSGFSVRLNEFGRLRRGP